MKEVKIRERRKQQDIQARMISCALVMILLIGLFFTIPPQPVQAANVPTDLGKKWDECVEKFTWTDTADTIERDAVWKQDEKTAVKVTAGACEVKTAAEFLWAVTDIAVSKIVLTADLDMGGSGDNEDSEGPLWPSPAVGRDLSIDGQGHTVYNVKARSTGSNWAGAIGLIGTVAGAKKFELYNFNCVSLNLSSPKGFAVGLVGGNSPYAAKMVPIIFENCSVENALLKGNDGVGAFYGVPTPNQGMNMKNCYSKEVYAYAPCRVGGLIGAVNSAEIENTYSIESIIISPTSTDSTYANMAGGFIGAINGTANFNNCFTNNTVYSASTAGGFIGSSNITSSLGGNEFSNCYATGLLEGSKNLGGFVGKVTDESGKKKSIFKNCYSASMVGMIGGGTTMGGFAGYAAARTVFENCYATGEVGSLDTDTQKFTSVGGFSGTIMGTYTNCIYDKQTTAMKNIGGGTAAGVTGKSTKAITGHVAEGDVAGKIISDGFATEENDPWVAEAGLYPQIKAFSDPAASGFPVDQVDLVKAYSLASASTVFLRDESSAEMPNNYDTVRDILELFSFTSVAKNGNYGFKWEVDPKHYDVGEKDIYSPIVTDKKTPVLSFDAKNIGIDDQITNMAPGIGWTRVTAMFTGIDGKLVTGNRALRIVPTAAISLGVANPDMGIGRDVRIFPDVDVNKTYNHREGVKLIRTTAEDLNKVPPKAPHGLYPDETYKNAVVMLAIDPESDDPELSTPENRGTIDVIIKKYDHTKPISQESLLSADVVPNDEAFMTDEQKAANARYRELFNGAKDFTKDDYGIYVLTYKWTVDGVVQTNSKKVYILPATALSYRYNDGDENTGSTESPLDDCYITGYHRANEKAGIEDNYEGQTFKLADGPTRSGYRFVGWSLDAAATPESYTANTDGKAFIVGSQLKEDTVVYAVWEIRNYDVCFKADGLDSFGMNTDTTVTGIGYGDSISATPGKAFPEVPTAGAVDHNTNKKFLGWSTMNPLDLPKDKDGKAIAQTVDFGADSSISTVGLGYSDYYKYFVDEKEANTVITVYPVIKTNEATLRFYNNDGSTINDKKGAQVGADYKILYGGTYPAAPVVSREGYIFRGWSTERKADFEPGEGKSYQDVYNAAAVFDGSTESITYVAVWEKAHTVTLMNNHSKEDITKTEIAGVEDSTALGDKLPAPSTAQAPKRDGYTFMGWSTIQNATSPNVTGMTLITKNETTLYAVWQVVNYTVSFYQNNTLEDNTVVRTITDQIWGNTLSSDQLKAATRDGGYSFAGWNTERDGSGIDFIAHTDEVEGTKIQGNTALYAKWTKNPYTLNVYKSPEIGKQPDQVIGSLVYGEKLGNKLPTAPNYYTNEKGEKFKFTGWMDHHKNTVTADTIYQIGQVPNDVGTLMAQYTTRVFDITGQKTGHGSIYALGTYAAGDNVLISWQADAGHKVSQIIIDGQIRDDLIGDAKAGNVSFLGLDSNHQISVTFVKGNAPEQPDNPDAEYYTVTTTKIGGDLEGIKTTLSQTATVAAGKNHSVNWEAKTGYHIVQIMVDGAEYPITNPGSLNFEKIGQDHTVVVTYASDVPDFDQSTTPGFWTITTRQSGGDPKAVDTGLTPTTVVKKNSNHDVQWHANAEKGYSIESIILDKDTGDEKILNADEIAKGRYAFSDIAKDHTVDVSFKNENQTDPTDKYLKIETKLIGGPGEITGSAAVKQGDDYTVNWHLPESITNPESETYNHYLIDQIIVNGDVKTPEEMNDAEFKNIQEDNKVVVVLKPNLVQVNTKKIGQGTIDPSTTLFYGQKYTVATAPAEGYYLAEINVDGKITIYTNPDAASRTRSVDVNASSAPEGGVILLDNEKITVNRTVKATFARRDEQPEEAFNEITTRIEGGKGTITPGSTVTKNSSTTISWQADSEFVVDHVTISRNGQVIDYPVDKGSSSVTFDQIVDDYNVVVTLKPGDGTENPNDKNALYTINTAIKGGAGAMITPTLQNVHEGMNKTITWSYPEDLYNIESIVIDGSLVDLSTLDKSYSFNDIKADHNIIVTLKTKEDPVDPPIDPPVNPGEKTYTISTSIAGADGGKIDGTKIVKEHEEHRVNWTVNEDYQMSAVIIDGIIRDDLRTETGYTFTDITADHHVIILIEKKKDVPPEIKPESYIVSTSKEGKGSITETTGVKAGANHTVNFKADKGYHIARVAIDGVNQPQFIQTGRVPFEKLSSNHHVEVIFEADKPVVSKWYHVTVILEDGVGTVSASGQVKEGENYDAYWQPQDGWYTQSISINGELHLELITQQKYSFKNIHSDQIIRVTFAKSDVDGSGTIRPGDDGNPWDNDKFIPKWQVGLGSMAPYTGLTGDVTGGPNIRSEMARRSLENGKNGSGRLADLFGALLGNPDSTIQKSDAITVLDLLITVGAILLCASSFIFKRRTKIAGITLTFLTLLLFFTTQPLLLKFIWVDEFTPLFLMLIGVQAIVFLCAGKQKEKRKEKRTIENS